MGNKQTVLKRSSPTTRGSKPQRTHEKNETCFSKEFQPKNRGRKAGVPNFITREVKEAIISACNRYGADGKGTGGLEGYLFKLCDEHPPVMGGLLRAIMPTQVTVERKERPKEYKSYEEMCAELERQYGIKLDRPVYQLEYYKGPVVELDEDVTNNTDDAKDR